MSDIKTTILVTGGAGYIGSHVCKALHLGGYLPVVYDNLSHGNQWAVKFGPFVKGDIHDFRTLSSTLERYEPKAAIHLAGSIHARESCLLPHFCYYNNVEGSRIFLQALVEHDVKYVVYTSSAAVYGNPGSLPAAENHPTLPTNAYGKTKLIVEGMLEDFQHAYGIEFAALRCFNACGADPEGELGESHPKETHLIPLAFKATLASLPPLAIYGDGSSLRDYVHVADIANAHLLALNHLLLRQGSCRVNIGSGIGRSVWDILRGIQELTQKPVPYVLYPEQNLESQHLVADTRQANKLLGFQPEHTCLQQILNSAWKWHTTGDLSSIGLECS